MVTEVPTDHTHLYAYAAALSADGPVTTIPLPHMVHSVHHGWLRQDAQSSPTLLLTIKLDREAYSNLRIRVPRSSLQARHIKSQRCCLDSGAQLVTIPVALLAHLGLRVEDLFPISTNLKTVTGSPVDLIGGVLLVFTGTHPQTGAVRSTRQLAYVSRSVPYPFLSREACADLGTIPASFPAIGSCDSSHAGCSHGQLQSPLHQHWCVQTRRAALLMSTQTATPIYATISPMCTHQGEPPSVEAVHPRQVRQQRLQPLRDAATPPHG